MKSCTAPRAARRALLSVGSLFVVASLAITRPAEAQTLDPQCTAGARELEDGCQKAIDLYNFLAPQLGVMMSGGSPTVGERPGAPRMLRISFDVRANLITGSIPDIAVDTPSIDGARSTDYPVQRRTIGLPVVTAGVTVFTGVPVGRFRALATDALVSVSYLPELSRDELDMRVESSSWRLGGGARVALLQEPEGGSSLSLSYIDRGLPVVDVEGRTTEGDTITLSGLRASVRSWRLVGTHHLGFLGLRAGWGRDALTSGARLSAVVTGEGYQVRGEPFAFDHSSTRDNLFAGVSIDFRFASVAAEVGRIAEGPATATYNTFSGEKPEQQRTYGSLGVRVGL